MRKIQLSIFMAVLLLLAACNSKESVETSSKNDDKMISKNEIKIPEGKVTPEALWAFGRMGGH